MRQLLAPIGIIALFVGLIVPLPASVIDYMLVVNVTLAMLLLVSALYISDPLKLSALPSFLLLATLFRLTLNISTTRLLLSTGDAGQVIQSFGEFVIQGNLIVGFIVFLIITFVQLIVITKGSERVAEVSARFTLDAMPGKQMSIDADLRAGAIDFEEARQKRNDLQTESRFYGSLDGAIKFIKGDALAGLLITAVNIIGGLAIGVMMLGLPFKSALMHYTLLTVGDGLLSQIPALLSSIAAGIVVTRVERKEGSNLATEVFQQLMSNKQVRIIIAVLALSFSLLPGIPFLPFLVISIILVLFSSRDPEKEKIAAEQKLPKFQPRNPPLLSLKFSKEYSGNLSKFQDLPTIIETFRQHVHLQTGLILPLPDLELNANTAGAMDLFFRSARIKTFSKNDLKEENPFIIATSYLLEFIMRYKHEFIDDTQTRRQLDFLEKDTPELISNLVPDVVSVTKISKILKQLLTENIPIRNLDLILQAIAENSECVKNERLTLEHVREALKRSISAVYAPNQEIQAVTIETEIDLAFYRSEKNDDQLRMDYLKELIRVVKTSVLTHPDLVVICSKGSRRLVSDCLEHHHIKVPVLAYEELMLEVKIISLARVSVPETELPVENNENLAKVM